MKRREQSQTEQLRRALTEREAQLHEAQARLAALEGSTSLQVGRALTAAAKRPARGLVRLPRDLYRLWRGSTRTRQAAGRRRPAQPVRSYEAERQESRLLAGTVGPLDGRLVVAGVLSPEARAAVDPYIRVVPLRPHDAQAVFDSVDVDAVLVTASATAPGTAWAHAGDPAASDRTRALRWVVEAAAARGVPSILVADAPAPPALAWLGFDHVHEGDLGVPLHRFNPVAVEPDRDPVPVHVPAATPERGRTAAALEALTGAGLRSAQPHWSGLPDVLRGSDAAVVTDPSLAERALACGTRVLLLAPSPTGRGGLDDGAHVVDPGPRGPGAEGIAMGLAQVREAGPLGAEELRLALRRLYLSAATPVRLAEIFGQVTLAPGSGGSDLPLRERRVTLLALPADDGTSLALAEDALKQEWPPAEVVVPEESAHLTGVERLRAHGLPVRTVPGVGTDSASPAAWARLAEAADTPWVALWREPRGAAFLADAVCAAECSGADAVGPVAAAWGTPGERTPADADAVDWAGADRDYVFVGAIQPELARRGLLVRALHPGVWNRHGARLLALGPLSGRSSGGAD
ncbi:hypothetical protein ACQEU5_05100 [Marinactinospora thermotolerans]|uniref:Uncharacterized protein n=1 Tax=Marinactinospora thermotolerans DSM 45154 TaxID=1122192 RepID=A0A1T4QMD1_9ACTN|nr:hypothetical protein [Marinactinospora thermotolerans]SKA04854.1 hypothetical protein SAMN02745673_02313 [Marinactinospora thermotolerans DSM 45154]